MDKQNPVATSAVKACGGSSAEVTLSNMYGAGERRRGKSTRTGTPPTLASNVEATSPLYLRQSKAAAQLEGIREESRAATACQRRGLPQGDSTRRFRTQFPFGLLQGGGVVHAESRVACRHVPHAACPNMRGRASERFERREGRTAAWRNTTCGGGRPSTHRKGWWRAA